MKKIIYVLFTIELLIVSLLGLNIVKDNEINNILYNDTTSISVMFKDYKKLNKNYSKWIKDIADENNVAISKYVFNNNEKLSIYTTDTSLNNNIRLKSGKFPNTNSNEFISNINTNNSNQVGKFSTMSKDISILIRDFGKISEVGESGILYISTQNEGTINKILKELNVDRSIFVARLHDRYVNSNLYLNPSIIRDLTLVILCFLATIIHYSISVSREASILRLNGYSKLDIIARVIKNILRIMILSSITALLIYIIYILKLNLGVRACLYFVMFSIICILINILISILIVGFNSRSSKYVLSLNGKKSYGFVNIMHFTLKIVFVSFLILSINNCILNYNMLQTQLGNLSEWDKAKNVYNLTLKDTGEQSLGKEEVIKNAKIKSFYKSLVEEKDAFLIDTTNFEKLEDGSYMYEINSKGKNPEVSQYGKNIKINKNYLKVNPIYSNGKEIFNLIDYDDKTINLLVPKKLQVHENDIKKEFRELFYFEKIEVENMYNEKLNRGLNKTKESEIDKFNLEISKGELVAITGNSGSGKTTLLNIMGLLEKPNSGDIIINNIKNPNSKQIRILQRDFYGYLFQNYALIENENVENNLKIALKYQKNINHNEKINYALESVSLRKYNKKKIYELSGGEQQRVALARVILKECEVIFADEPTGNLDKKNRDIVFDILKSLNKNGKTIVFVTHDLELSEQADRVIKL